MASFGQVFKQLSLKKIKVMTQLVILEIASTIVLWIYSYFSGFFVERADVQSFSFGYLTGSICVAGIVALAYLTIRLMNEANHNKYRLLPISDFKLYLSSFFSSFVSLLYLCLIDLLLIFGIVYGMHADKFIVPRQDLSDVWIEIFLGLMLIFFSMLLMMILFSTTSILGSIIADLIPGGKQLIVRLLVYAVALFIIYEIGYFINISGILPGVTLSDDKIQLLVANAQVGFELLVFVILNMNLLRFVETSK